VPAAAASYSQPVQTSAASAACAECQRADCGDASQPILCVHDSPLFLVPVDP
jgi:hypothetical protein